MSIYVRSSIIKDGNGSNTRTETHIRFSLALSDENDTDVMAEMADVWNLGK